MSGGNRRKGCGRVGASILLLVAGLLGSFSALAGIDVTTQSLRLGFNDQGDLVRAQACFPACSEAGAQIQLFSSEQGMLVFRQPEPGQRDPGPLLAERHRDKNATVLTFTDSEQRVVRRWQIPDEGWLIEVSTLAAPTAVMLSGADFRPPPASGFGYLLEQRRYLVFAGSKVENIGFDEAQQASRMNDGWFGFRNRFWTAMLLPATPVSFKPISGELLADARLELQFDSRVRQQLQLYLGPVEPAALKQAAPELEGLMYSGLWFWLRWICQALYFLLSSIVILLPHWGLAVMALSVVVGLLMRPLNNIAERLQDQVQQIDARLAPVLTAIKKNYKGAEQSEKIIAMYKEEGVHPLYSLKSLAGVMLVIPIFIGAFDMLAENIHLAGATFLWIRDLSHPDAFIQLPFSVPFFGAYLNLLPFVMTGFSFVASKLHRQPALDAALQRKQTRNLVAMSLGFLILFYTFPAGMVLYWVTNNLISVVKMLWKRRLNAD